MSEETNEKQIFRIYSKGKHLPNILTRKISEIFIFYHFEEGLQKGYDLNH